MERPSARESGLSCRGPASLAGVGRPVAGQRLRIDALLDGSAQRRRPETRGQTLQEPLAADAGDDNALEASGSDGSDAGEDAGLAAIGGAVPMAPGAGDVGGATSLLLQPESAAAHASAQRTVIRFMENPFLGSGAIVRPATDGHCRARPLSGAGCLRQSS